MQRLVFALGLLLFAIQAPAQERGLPVPSANLDALLNFTQEDAWHYALYTCSERILTLYTGELKAASGQSFFGSVQAGVQIHATCRLWLVRDTRHGENAHDHHRLGGR